jgi:hypothetical protein
LNGALDLARRKSLTSDSPWQYGLSAPLKGEFMFEENDEFDLVHAATSIAILIFLIWFWFTAGRIVLGWSAS